MNTILLTGNTRLFPTEALAYFNTAHSVYIADKNRNDVKESIPENIRWFSTDPSDNDFGRIFEAGRISAVWYVTHCADGGKPVDETDRIETILQQCARSGVGRMVVITESTDPADYRWMIGKWSEPEEAGQKVEMAVVCLPLVSGTDINRSRLSRIFKLMQKKRFVSLKGTAGSPAAILTIRELCSLLVRMTSESWFRPGIYSATGNITSLENFREVLLSCRPDAQIGFTGKDGEMQKAPGSDPRGSVVIELPAPYMGGLDGSLEEMYSLPAMIDWKETVAAQYAKLIQESEDRLPFREKAAAYLGRFGRFSVVILDLLVMFVITEFLAKITSDSVYFKIVDVRLLYVVLMGMMHGLAAGTGAAVLQCIMLVLRYKEIGISGLLLFYNVENWIPFVFYLTAGVICGYTHQKNEQKIRSVSAENGLIRKKYLFLNDAYRESVRDKKELRAQVLSEEESYRKLYEAIRRLSQRTPEAVCVESVKVIRELLDNNTFCIYQINPANGRAYLLSCCRENATRSQIDTAQFPEMMNAVGNGGTWRNTGFMEGAPMYASMVSFERILSPESGNKDVIRLLVTVEQAAQEQQSLWYVSHFSILCGLLQDALEHACLRERVLE